MPRKLSGFERMWNVYPAPVGEAAEAKSIIGGGANVGWIDNTCVIRISRCLNYAGHPVPQGYKGLETVGGADGLRYAYRVTELDAYLRASYGAPSISEDRDPPSPIAPESFAGQKGLVCFHVKGWSDATGHFDLWDGARPRHAEYFAGASSVMLWRVASDGTTHLGEGARPVPIDKSVGQGGDNDREDVARVQSLLAARGFDAGPADGLLGPRTMAAIVAFQTAMGKVTDGRVDPNGRTWRDLNGL